MNNSVKTKKKKKRIKRKAKKFFKRIIGIVALLLIGYIGYIGYYVAKVPEEVKNSNDLVIQNLLKKVNNNPKASMILSDINSYPRELIELASEKDETIDFVADYPNYHGSTNKVISIKKDYKKGQIPLFIQWDERWGYEKYGSDFIAINGCGPTSLAMVAVGLTGNKDINPKVVAEFSDENGYLVDGVGSSWTLMTEGAGHFGLKSKELSLNEEAIIGTLKKGQPIIASMGPGTFTSEGHYLVLTGVDRNNKIIINDSNSKIKSSQTWDIDVFMNEAQNLWTFTAM
ncbi:C39 family peptidase [Clostridium sp. UBA1056]|uniref:C39 family peptidase n=1 Tax=Clostridium sp. UBA1056 TaxID=1946346 RepID=UPI003217E435